MSQPPGGSRLVVVGVCGRRVVLVLLAVSAAQVGVWAVLAPRSFFAGFPGGGHRWVVGDGPFNGHLVRDVGAFYLALLVLTLGAVRRPEPQLVRVTGLVWLVFSVPHLAYHAGHLGGLGGVDRLLELVALSVTVLLAALLCLPVRTRVPLGMSQPPGRRRPTSTGS